VDGRSEGFEGGGNLLLIDRDLHITVLLLGRYAAIRFTHPRMFPDLGDCDSFCCILFQESGKEILQLWRYLWTDRLDGEREEGGKKRRMSVS
jgi:hypothetical protein